MKISIISIFNICIYFLNLSTIFEKSISKNVHGCASMGCFQWYRVEGLGVVLGFGEFIRSNSQNSRCGVFVGFINRVLGLRIFGL